MITSRFGWKDWRDIAPFEQPWYVGRADERIHIREILLLPVPLNYLYGWGVRAYYYVRRGKARENENRAFGLGNKQGWDDGYRYGLECGKREMDPEKLRNRLALLEDIVADFPIPGVD